MEREENVGDGSGGPLSLILLAVGLVVIAIISLGIGRYWVAPGTVATILGGQVLPLPDVDQTAETVVLGIRLPRIIGAILIGAALASSGAAYQSLFRNPLVSPAILGVAAGAGLGAAIGILIGLPWLAVQALAFGCGLLATTASLLIGRTLGSGSIVVLVLGGLVVSAAFQALISLTQYLADPDDTLPAITFWLMGGLGRIGQDDLLAPAILILICLISLFALRWPINVLAAGDDDARSLGIDRRITWAVVIAAATLMTATAVSLAGIVGWVGLLIPHAARFIVGPSFHRVLPASVLLGAAFLLLVDDVARSASTMELPLGILTALIGAPFFVFLLSRARNQWL